jgi:hypothetical protein
MSKSQEETEPWRILLFGRNGAELLLVRSASGIRLPELRIPRWQRIVPNLNAEAKRLWNLETVCLFPFDVPYSDLAAVNCKYQVMEVSKPEELARVAPDFVLLSGLKEGSFAERRDYLAVQQGMGCKGGCFPKDCQGPFSEFGTFGRISVWVEEQLRRLGLRWDGTFRQLQASAFFALIRFQTNRSGVWFKAVGEPNLREFPITKALADWFPKHVPKVIAAREDWNAWLAEEIEGEDLFSASDPASWHCAVGRLAELQITSVRHASQILACGARDARSPRLLDMVVPFFSTIESLMEAQIKPAPRKLTAQEIKTVEQHVTDALLQMERSGVPDTLNHFDLNPGNAIAVNGNCKFLDWAEAGIGIPFFSMEYLRLHFLSAFAGQHDAEIEFRNSYFDHWRSVVPGSTVERVGELVPLLAAFAFAALVLPWDTPNLIARPGVAGLLRSLARRMYRECEHLSSLAAQIPAT